MKKVVPAFFLFGIFAFSCSSQSVQKFTVHFDFNAYALTAGEKSYLDSVARFVMDKDHVVDKIEIAGHCDSVGSYQYNYLLSQNRANAVFEYLVSHNIDRQLIKEYKGYGKNYPLNDNKDSVKRSLNRRVEIQVYYIAQPEPRPIDTVTGIKPVENEIAKEASADSLKTLDLSKIAINGTMVLHNIVFYPNSHEPEQQSYPYLKVLLNTLRQNKNLRIEIQGHVCCSSPLGEDQMDQETYTPDLSVQRAKYIYNYLIYNGIEAERLSYRGFAGKRHIAIEVNEEAKEKNRRVEIKILSK